MLEEIDGIAVRRLDQPDRSAVIRELLAEALAARRKDTTRSASASD
jgi:metal-responsive CopG/Arc/MetJ family transcriptional regulator